MLIELHIENFAIIENLDLQLSPGLIAFTGETGAGKSIMIDAIETLLGGRAEAIQVRSGEDRASIEAVFSLSEKTSSSLRELLEREDLLEEGEHVILAREVRINGRNVARVNGHSVSASLLREIGSSLIDIHGQSEHLSLLRVAEHLDLLDRFAALQPISSLVPYLKNYKHTYQLIEKLRHELIELRGIEKDAARKEDILNFQIHEIESAHLRPNEDIDLQTERNRLANAKSLAKAAQESLLVLDEGTIEAPTASDLIGQASQALFTLSRLDPDQAYLYENVQNIFENITDLNRNIRDYFENIEFNPKRLDEVEERLALIQLLKRKYGDSISAIQDFLKNAREQLDQISHAEERIVELENRLEALLSRLGEEGKMLSDERRRAASDLENRVEIELSDLQMPGARFKVDFKQQLDENGARISDGTRWAYYPKGLDKIEFLIAPNPGEGFKPLVKIASGGETSRLMLAMKNVLANADEIPTLVFDEIDQGVGGRVGTTVGQKLWRLARQHQVLCITHLPQLAAFGDQHFHIEKRIEMGRTITVVRQISGEERIQELAQMLGGSGAAAFQSAQELLSFAQEFRITS